MKNTKKGFKAGLAVIAITASFTVGCSRIDNISEPSDVSSASLDKKASVSYSANKINVASGSEDSLKSTANELYEKAVHMYFGMLFNGSYYTTGSEEIQPQFMNITDSRITCIDDIKAELRTVFSESLAIQYDSKIEQNYKEANGKVYQLNHGKGGNVSLIDWDIDTVSINDTEALFNVTSHYYYGDVVHSLRLIYENNSWKISEYSDPNTEPYIEGSQQISSKPSFESAENIVEELYENAVHMYFGMLFNGSYYTTGSEEIQPQFMNITDSRITCINDIKAELRTVFSESLAIQYDSKIEQNYKEANGKVYQLNHGKGGNVSLIDWDIDTVSINDTEALFNVTSHYYYGDVVHSLRLIYENNSWKISEYSDPNTEPYPSSADTKPVEENTIESVTTNISTEYLNSFAKEMYLNASSLFFKMLVNGTYFEENGESIQDGYGTDLYRISDSRAVEIEDIKNIVREAFTESLAAEYDSRIESIYTESDGILYQKHMGKGGVYSEEDIELEVISADESYAVFSVKKYQPFTQRTGNYTEDRFAITKENGCWKICEFNY